MKPDNLEMTATSSLAFPELAEDFETRRRSGVDVSAYPVAFAGDLGELLVVPGSMLAGFAVDGSVIWFGTDESDPQDRAHRRREPAPEAAMSFGGYLNARRRTWRWQFVGTRFVLGRGPAEWATSESAHASGDARTAGSSSTCSSVTGLHVVE